MVYFSLFPTSLGDCGIAWRGDLIVATRLPDKSPEETVRRLTTQTGGAVGEPSSAVRSAIKAMVALLDGAPTDLTSVACDFGGLDPFAVQVYSATRQIPPGQTSTYGAIALQLGDKQRARDVGQALGRNPIPIIVPCHRIVGADGKLTGFSAAGGIATKLRMLAIEGAQVGDGPGLFDDLPLAVKPPD